MNLILDLVFLHSRSIKVLCKIAYLSHATYDRYCSIYVNDTKISLIILFDHLYTSPLHEYYEFRICNMSYWKISSSLLNIEFVGKLCNNKYILREIESTYDEEYVYIKVNIGGKSAFIDHLVNVLKYVDYIEY